MWNISLRGGKLKNLGPKYEKCFGNISVEVGNLPVCAIVFCRLEFKNCVAWKILPFFSKVIIMVLTTNLSYSDINAHL